MDRPEPLRRIEPLRVLALRHLPGGEPALRAALAELGLHELPRPGQMLGRWLEHDPALWWSRPGEWLLLAMRPAPDAFDALRDALAPRPGAQAMAFDLSQGHCGFECAGPDVREWLLRLTDAQALPSQPGTGTWLRMADLRVAVWCVEPTGFRLLVDRAAEHHFTAWLAYAEEALVSGEPRD